ncbi:MAG: ATP-binding protein [Planctomycetaceae bacterium]|nr:ATP-binding protein [Planctomycetaceae bacterium]
MKATQTQWGDYGKCLHHWLWAEKALALSQVDEDLLRDIIESPVDVEARLFEDLGEADLVAKNALRIEDRPKPGIRFLVFISSATESDKSMPNDAKHQFAEVVVNDVLSIDGITHEEIYEGENSDWLIIDARAEFENYFAINDLKTVLHRSMLASYGCRITTYLCCNNIEGALEQEKLCATHDQKAPPLTEEDVRFTLERPETGQVEVKGSVQQDLQAFFDDGTVAKMKPKDNVDPILKTVAGFLNTNGGLLIIGAIEEIHFQGVDLSEYPQIGDHRLCGIDSGMDFDKAERTVTNKIRQQISSTASRLCKISYFKIEEKEVMTVEVRRSPTVQNYQGNIYVRENAQTRQLNGAEVAEFVTSRTI